MCVTYTAHEQGSYIAPKITILGEAQTEHARLSINGCEFERTTFKRRAGPLNTQSQVRTKLEHINYTLK